MPNLSVILPVHNGEKFIATAIRSTLTAMPRDSELVVFDDGSTDRTPEILGRIDSARFRVLPGVAGKGLSSALNTLIESTQSNFIARMDADDIVLPMRFRAQLSVLSRGVDFSFLPVLHLGPSRFKVRPTRINRMESDELRLRLLLDNPVAHSTLVCRRDAIEELGGYRDVRSEDYDLWMRAAAAGYSLHRSNVPGLLYRHHDSQVTASDSWLKESRVEPLLVAAHDDLSAKELGQSFDCLEAIRRPSLASAECIGRGSVMIDRIIALARKRLSPPAIRRLSARADSISSVWRAR
ncbi:glycosyltransferase family 2 protein [Rhodococcus sp. NCIMB 12038]|uniref:glycosyltransferase family 2 protein n=1 Tax=Rhodococcus sp. NCIMB 12038 TaxID=933800 RepID=UPI000B3CCAE8|nr:hypothetical protein CA951_38215 [Rhodococcus sp. NCIMB 12038]